MAREGLLRRVANESTKEALYQYIDPLNCLGVIHLVCEKCSKTHHLNRHVSELVTNMALDDFGFDVNQHKAIIYGLCKNCLQIEEK